MVFNARCICCTSIFLLLAHLHVFSTIAFPQKKNSLGSHFKISLGSRGLVPKFIWNTMGKNMATLNHHCDICDWNWLEIIPNLCISILFCRAFHLISVNHKNLVAFLSFAFSPTCKNVFSMSPFLICNVCWIFFYFVRMVSSWKFRPFFSYIQMNTRSLSIGRATLCY